jgi:8-oxo-dGTP pyrophosphatase MutT (NUDIX family)
LRLAPIQAYLRRHPAETALSRLREQLQAPADMFSRKNMTGHITASGFVVTPDRRETLVVGHKGLGKWLPPGGHVDDGDAAIWLAAQREVGEETGVTDLALHPWHAGHDFEPADIDTHPIPPRPAKQEGAHWHHDCLYVFVAPKVPIKLEEDALFAASWCAIDDPKVPARLQRICNGLLRHR